jgi:hypothetical protein
MFETLSCSTETPEHPSWRYACRDFAYLPSHASEAGNLIAPGRPLSTPMHEEPPSGKDPNEMK